MAELRFSVWITVGEDVDDVDNRVIEKHAERLDGLIDNYYECWIEYESKGE